MSTVTTENRQLSLTERDIELFIQAAQTAGLSPNSLKRYRSDLVILRRYLGPSGVIRPGTLLHWQIEMRRQGYASRTVTTRTLTANQYLIYKGRPDLCEAALHYEIDPGATLTRAEYDNLLQTARRSGCLREELLLRLFAEIGIPLNALAQVTVEAVQAGALVLKSRGSLCTVQLPRDLQAALQRYARQQGIGAGPVFLTRTGNLLQRSNISALLQKVARYAGLPPEKVTHRCLQEFGAARAGRSRPPRPNNKPPQAVGTPPGTLPAARPPHPPQGEVARPAARQSD